MEENINHLIARCEAYFRDTHYSAVTIRNNMNRWKWGILKFMKEKADENYSPPMGDEFLTHIDSLGVYTTGTINEYRQSIRKLNDMLELGFIRRTSREPREYPLNGLIGKDMSDFMESLNERRLHHKTMTLYHRHLSYFLEYLTSGKSLEKSEQIRESDIITYMEMCPNRARALPTIRTFLSYLWKSKRIQTDFEEFFKRFRIRLKERVPSYYSTEEIKQIETSINRNCGLGKRDYAMVLLASRLGLRASDIASLAFVDIDWENSRILKRMVKTGNDIELPLLPEVGNAIIDYIKNARPISDEKLIFLTHNSPYRPLSAYGVCGKINRLITESGVDVSGRHHGPHSLRHSLASALLGNSMTVDTISGVLGHQSSAPTMRYLSIDIASLAKCGLEVPPVLDSFYNQKGGIFYERR